MAVNLKATATLNGKPFLSTIDKLAAATAKLSTSQVVGSQKATSAEDQLIKTREQGGKAYLNQVRALEGASNRASGSMKNLTTTSEQRRLSLRNLTAGEQAQITELRNLTTAQAQASTAARTLSAANERLQIIQRQGITQGKQRIDAERAVIQAQQGVAQAENAVERAQNARWAAQGKAQLAYEAGQKKAFEQNQARHTKDIASAQRLYESRQKAIFQEKSYQSAMREGAVVTEERARALQKLNTVDLQRQQILNRQALAQAKHTQALASGTGIVAAEQGMISSTMALRNFDAAQQAAAESGSRLGSGLAAQRYLYHDISRQLATTSLALAALPAVGIGVAALWEKNFSAVVRTADPEFIRAPERVNALRSSLGAMAQAMPVALGEVTEIATLANQMGMASTQTVDFARAVAMFSATSGVSVDMAATAFGRLTSILGDSAIGYQDMADSILKVGVNSVATEDEIINVMTQVSSIAAQAGFGAKEMIGLSGALASVRVPPELSRGLITRVFGQFDKAVARGSTGLDTLARISGVSSAQFKKDWGGEGAADLFNDFLRGLRDAGGEARSELASLGITSVRDNPVLLRLANAADSEGNVGELFTQTLKDANNAAGETQRQYTIMSETVVERLKVLGNNLLAFFDGAGQSGLGVFGDMVDSAAKGIRELTNSLDEPHALLGIFGQTNADVVGLIASLALGVAAFTAIGSAIAKVASAGAAFGQLSGVIGASGLMGTLGKMQGATWGGSGVTAFASSAAKGTKAATGLGAALKGIGGIVFGPYGLALTAGAVALGVLNSKMQEGVTSSADLAQSLAAINPASTGAVDRELAKIKVAGPSDFLGSELNSNPFEGGLKDAQAAMKKLNKIREANNYSWFGSEQTFELGQWLERSFTGSWDEVAGLEQIDDAIQQLADGGNGPKAIKMLQTLGGSGKDLMNFLDSAEGSKSKGFLENAFGLVDLEVTEQSLDMLIRGQLPQVTDAMYGVANATKAVEEAFEGSEGGYTDFINKIDGTAAAFIDFGAAAEKATSVTKDGGFAGFSLDTFTKTLRDQVDEQEQWIEDITTITKYGSAGVVESLAALGPAGKHAATALAAGLKAGTPEALDALKQMEESVLAEAVGLGNDLAESMANQSWASKLLGSNDMGRNLVATLGDDKMSQLYDAAEGVGSETAERILQGLQRGDMDFDQALRALLVGQDLKMPVTLETKDAAKAFTAIEEVFKGKGVEVSIDADTSVSKLRNALDDPTLNKIELDGDLTLTEAYASSREFQVWAQEQQIDMLLGANDMPAKLSLAALIAYASNEKIRMAIDAAPDPAIGNILTIIEFADGQQGIVEIDGDGTLAKNEIQMIDAETGKTRTIPLDGNNLKAIEKVLEVSDTASANPASINVTAVDNASGDIDHIARPRETTVTVTTVGSINPNAGNSVEKDTFTPWWGKADGGTMEYYANGGINAKHVAQIAPAGSMRVWAEPETEGEAYIPFARSKRTRSLAILDQVAQRFGYSVAKGNNVTQYADGGTYNAQRMARAYTPSVQSSGGIGLSTSDRQFFAQMLRTVVVQADGQRITGMTNNINETNARFGR